MRSGSTPAGPASLHSSPPLLREKPGAAFGVCSAQPRAFPHALLLVFLTSLAALLGAASCTAGPAAGGLPAPSGAPGPASGKPAKRIDRYALVTRHNPSLTSVDPASPLMVGNGNLALAADITGLATFQDQYSPLVPLMIQSQWAWHEFPNPQGHRFEQSLVPVEVRGKIQHYPWLKDWAEAKQPAIAWLRENPHRFSLGRLSFFFAPVGGKPVTFEQLRGTRQSLDLWTGRLSSTFTLPADGAEPGLGEPVEVETSVHPELDLVIVRVRSPLLERGRLGIELAFPGVSRALQPDPADFTRPDAHRTLSLAQDGRGVTLERQLDATRYYVAVRADRAVDVRNVAPHDYRITAPKDRSLTLLVAFSPEPLAAPLPDAEAARAAVASFWHDYWTRGGAIDLSRSADPRATELERRIVLSRYLMAVNAAGRVPPQEEGLFSNSWYGKFHLEMHPWHAAHFAAWGHPELLERSMGWYLQHLPAARERALAHGVRGAWWPKMVGPEGRESPSTINPFIMWQQPHPIYLAELLYRATPNRATLERYRELVFDSADLLASFPHRDPAGRFMLGPPLIPAQEVYPPLATFNPTFELEYFHFGLSTALAWRPRLGRGAEPRWQQVLQQLAPLPQKDGVYLAAESQPELWAEARSPRCSPGPAPDDCDNRDHPSFLAAFGLLPGQRVDRASMRRTLDAVEQSWDLRQTWGWDYPLLAMTATRLHEPGRAVSFLLHGSKNFQFGRSGMTPRVHVAPSAPPGAAAGPDGPGYRRAAETYFPSNGSLLLAVALMAAGWDGETSVHPGFPSDWHVESEGLLPLP
jgi:hypothetical protein